MKTWYALKADDKKATMSIFDDIGAYGVSAKNFLNDLRGIKASEVDVEINSPGGDVFAGIAIHNGLRASGKMINVKVMGLAASAASLIAMAGDTIEMPANAFMMIHNPWGFAMGDAEEMRNTADTLDKIGTSLVATYAKRTGKDADEIAAMLNAETWLTADEALAQGFATKVTDAVAAKASFELDRLPENVRKVYAEAGTAEGGDVDPENPDADDSSATAEEVKFGETLADQITEVANAAGMGVYAALWSADPSIADKDAAIARATLAREVKALCDRAGHGALADGLIRAKASLADARKQVFAALEAGSPDEVDTAPASARNKAPAPVQAGVKGGDIWAARRAKFKTI